MWTQARVRALVAGDPALGAIRAEAETRAAADADPGHDLAHLLRVAVWTLELASDAPEQRDPVDRRDPVDQCDPVDPRDAIAAALLHDAINPPKDAAASATASELSADLARDLLPGLGFAATAVDDIATAIRDHSYSRGAVPTSPLGRALQDADRLDALGAIGVFRTVACGIRLGAELYDPEDPWAERRELDDRRFTVDHFFTKLLLLPETMNTKRGRAEARARIEPMQRFLESLGREIGVPLPPHRIAAP